MDLNSYLTDFFKLLQNSSNNIYGGQGLTGGFAAGHFCAMRPDGTFATNADIIQYYFDLGTVDRITVNSGITLKDGPLGSEGAKRRADFVAHQPEIVTHMLTTNKDNNGNFVGLSGGLRRYIYGGATNGPSSAADAAAAAAAAIVGAKPAGTVIGTVPVTGPPYSDIDILYNLVKGEIEKAGTKFKFSNLFKRSQFNFENKKAMKDARKMLIDYLNTPNLLVGKTKTKNEILDTIFGQLIQADDFVDTEVDRNENQYLNEVAGYIIQIKDEI